MGAKKIIINADDFGFSRAVVDVIIELYQLGLVTSTSVMATMPAYEYGVGKLKDNPGLGAGVHLSLFDGRPVLPVHQVPSLVDKDTGEFLKYEVIDKKRRTINIAEAAAEYEAQIQDCLSRGIKPTHLDVHTFMPYMIPKLYTEILKLNKKYHLPMRTLISRDFREKSRQLAARQKLPAFILRMAGGRLLKGMAKYGIDHPDYFNPDFSNGDNKAPVVEKSETLVRILQNLPDGITELLTHPSSADDPWRQSEYGAFLKAAQAFRELEGDVVLGHYGDFFPEL